MKRSENCFLISYILLDYFKKNPKYLCGTFSRIPISSKLLRDFGAEDLIVALEFLYDYRILSSSVREHTSVLFIYNIDFEKTNMFIDIFWNELGCKQAKIAEQYKELEILV